MNLYNKNNYLCCLFDIKYISWSIVNFTTVPSSSRRLSRLTPFLHVALHPVFSWFSLRGRFNCVSSFFHSIILLKSTRLAVSQRLKQCSSKLGEPLLRYIAINLSGYSRQIIPSRVTRMECRMNNYEIWEDEESFFLVARLKYRESSRHFIRGRLFRRG